MGASSREREGLLALGSTRASNLETQKHRSPSDPAHFASWLQEIHFMDVLSHLVMARKCGGGGDFGGS
jgi:hypothetical protein